MAKIYPDERRVYELIESLNEALRVRGYRGNLPYVTYSVTGTDVDVAMGVEALAALTEIIEGRS
jgi:hypothetical protein